MKSKKLNTTLSFLELLLGILTTILTIVALVISKNTTTLIVVVAVAFFSIGLFGIIHGSMGLYMQKGDK